jgi:hypothetical protein
MRAVNDNRAPKAKAGSIMSNALRLFFSLFDPADVREFSSLRLFRGQPARRRRAPHRQRRASIHAMRFRKPQIRRTLPLLVETPLSRAC